MDTPDQIGDGHKYYSSLGSDKLYDHHHYYSYRRSDNGYFLDGFKKDKSPTFNGDLKKPNDEKAWLLGMKKFFELHHYTDNMKVKIAIFNLKSKADI